MPAPRPAIEAGHFAYPSSIEPISMRIPEACRFTGISRSTLYLLIARGEVEIIKLGTTTLVLTASLRGLVESRRRPIAISGDQAAR